MYIEFRNATLDDVDELHQLESALYLDEPLDIAMYPRQPDGSRHPQIEVEVKDGWRRLVEEAMEGEQLDNPAECLTRVQVAVDVDPINEDGRPKIVGYAAWDWHTADSSEEEEFGWVGTDSEQKQGIANTEFSRNRGRRICKLRRDVMGTKKEYWELWTIGVHQDYRRQGIASTLLRAGFNRADEEKAEIWIESYPDGTALYESSSELVKVGEVAVELPGGGKHKTTCFRRKVEMDEAPAVLEAGVKPDSKHGKDATITENDKKYQTLQVAVPAIEEKKANRETPAHVQRGDRYDGSRWLSLKCLQLW